MYNFAHVKETKSNYFFIKKQKLFINKFYI